MSSKLCSRCGNASSEEALFCPRCGNSLKGINADPLVGSVIADRYLLVEKIGEGHSGTVYRGEQTNLKKKVAVKVLHHSLSKDEGALERFRREATTVGEIDNEHIVSVHDFGRAPDGRLFFAMEYIEGATLADIIKREGKLDVDRTVDIALQVGEALMEAHGVGFVHRDLRPRNIMLKKRGKNEFVKLLDFGLSKLVLPTELKAGQTAILSIGDPRYMAPELLRGEAADRRTDIYSLGVIMFEMLTGVVPYEGATPPALLAAMAGGKMPALRDRRKEVPEWLEKAVQTAFAPVAERRFVTILKMTECLEAEEAPTAEATGMAAAEKAASEKLAAEKAASEKLAAEKAASEKLAAEKAASEKLAAEKAASERRAAEEKAASEKAAAQRRAGEEKAAAERRAAEEKSAKEKAAAERRAAEEKAAAEKVAAEKAAVAERRAGEEKAAAEKKVAAEKIAADKVAADKVAAEKIAAEKIAAEKVAAEKMVAEKAAIERRAADEKAAQQRAAALAAVTRPASQQQPAAQKPQSGTPAQQFAGGKKSKRQQRLEKHRGGGDEGRRGEDASSDLAAAGGTTLLMPTISPGKDEAAAVINTPPAGAVAASGETGSDKIHGAHADVVKGAKVEVAADLAPRRDERKTEVKRNGVESGKHGAVGGASHTGEHERLWFDDGSSPKPLVDDDHYDDHGKKNRGLFIGLGVAGAFIVGAVGIAMFARAPKKEAVKERSYDEPAVATTVAARQGEKKDEPKAPDSPNSIGTPAAIVQQPGGEAQQTDEAKKAEEAQKAAEMKKADEAKAAAEAKAKADEEAKAKADEAAKAAKAGDEKADKEAKATAAAQAKADEKARAKVEKEASAKAAADEAKAKLAAAEEKKAEARRAADEAKKAAEEARKAEEATKKVATAKAEPKKASDPKKTVDPFRDPFSPTAAKQQAASADLLLKSGRQKLESGDVGAAMADFKKARDLDSKSSEAVAGLGECAFEQGDYGQAATQLKSAVRLAPKKTRYQVLLGQAYYKLDNYKGAEDECGKVMKTDPGNAEAKHCFEAAQRKLGH